MKKLFFIVLNLFAFSAWSGPFGLEMGMPLETLQKQIKLKEVKPHLYGTNALPQGHSDFDEYRLVITPKHGLCRIVAWNSAIPTNVYGTQLTSKFESIENALVKKYGTGVESKFLREGSIWNESRYWMIGLLKEERALAVYWPLEGKMLPDNLATIKLQAHASDTDEGMLELGYEFNNFHECFEWMRSQADSVL